MKLSPCGIDCSACAIYKAARNPLEALKLAEVWRAAGYAEAASEWFRCDGCTGDRSACWSEDCRIRTCAIEEKALTSCSQCAEFPCEALVEWGAKGDHHREALQRLWRMNRKEHEA